MPEPLKNTDLQQKIHDARGPLNRISMNAELIKLVLENDMPKEKAFAAIDKILVACSDCSEKLQAIADVK